MSIRSVLGLAFAAVVATGLVAASADAKGVNLNLQNQNHMGHCDVSGNCRPGHTGTSMPTASPPRGDRGSVGTLSNDAAHVSGSHSGGGGGRLGGGGRHR